MMSSGRFKASLGVELSLSRPPSSNPHAESSFGMTKVLIFQRTRIRDGHTLRYLARNNLATERGSSSQCNQGLNFFFNRRRVLYSVFISSRSC